VILPYEDGAEQHVIRLGVGPWAELAETFEGVRLQRLFTAMPPGRIGELVARATNRDRRYRASNLLTYFVINVPAGLDPEALADALAEWPHVETAYVDPLDASPGPTGTNPAYPLQKYLKPPATSAPPAPQGAIDAEFAWAQAGGDGAGQKFADLERGATLNQEDIAAHNVQMLYGINSASPSDRLHGAKVLCVVAGVDNDRGVVGIAYGLSEVTYTCQVVTAGGTVDRPDAVLAAIQHFTQPGESPVGRVLLLEVELGAANDLISLKDVNNVVWTGMPMETALADYEMIRLATALGIVVVEAAGNGNHDLDLFQQKSSGQFVLRRTGGRDDSGAIMVGGSTSDYPYDRAIVGTQGSCFGSRVDCFAWAFSVATYDGGVDVTGKDTYSAVFGGTSAASAIVAGAALLVQGAAEATLGHRLDPAESRALLADPNINTPSHTPAVDRIGVMPNLKRILQDSLGIAPDVYMRDYVGDGGAVHTGAISLSPDIIVRPTAVAQPDVTFGPGTENDLMLGPTATAGQDNFVYVRVWNRAQVSDASNVTATVFYASAATLVTADDWKLVGTAVLPTVLANNVMTVSPEIRWPAVSVPPAGHYCFVALVGNAQDPAPTRANFLNFDYFFAYIRNNNNVTWRNFDVVAAAAPGAPGSLTVDGYDFEFAAPGAFDSDRSFQLAVGANLPPGSRVWLEAPLALLGDRLRFKEPDTGRNIGRVPIGPHGRMTLPALEFPAKSRWPCRLLVRVDSQYREGNWAVYVSQLYEGFEVGRITWRIVPR
jgi:serine protease